MNNKPDIWFTSDLHFAHRNILNFTNPRPFEDIDAHDEALIVNWNKVVKPGDVVYVIGDVSLRGTVEMLRDRLSRLNGSKHLILGNHDRSKVHAQLLNENIWQSMRDSHNLIVDIDNEKWFFKLSHFPILEFDGAYHKNTVHLYGHIHNITNYDDIYKKLGFKALHIGVDTSDVFPNTAPYSPININDVIARATTMFGTESADSMPRYKGEKLPVLEEFGLYKLNTGDIVKLSKNIDNSETPWRGIIINLTYESTYECYYDFDNSGRTICGRANILHRVWG